MATNRKAAVGFIFITLLIDVMGWGLIIPVMPKLISELKEKKLSQPVGSMVPNELIFPLEFAGAFPISESRVFEPINLDRDIYLPLVDKGERRFLALTEKDPDLVVKEKELFWILFTPMASQQPTARTLFWFFASSAFLIAVLDVVLNLKDAYLYIFK